MYTSFRQKAKTNSDLYNKKQNSEVCRPLPQWIATKKVVRACGNRVGTQKTMLNNVWEMIHETKITIDIVLQLLLFVVVSNY